MIKYLLVALLIACAPLPASAQRANGEQLFSRVSTPMFVRKATASNLFEIRSSQLALARSRDNRVRSFARRMIKDHRQMQAALGRTGVGQPREMLDAQHLNLLGHLRNMRRRDFDNAFAEAQIDAHQNAIDLHRTYARAGQNPRLRQFARNVLPTLESHLDMALRLSPRVAAR